MSITNKRPNLPRPPRMTPADKTEWLPLGVFALSRGDTGVSNTVLQLAVSKEGVISGTYYNSDTDIARPVKGTVDKKTQRAAWTFADGKDTNIVMEAGINNLTQDQTEALVHFGKDITQQWLMVRLQKPPAQKTETGASRGSGDASQYEKRLVSPGSDHALVPQMSLSGQAEHCGFSSTASAATTEQKQEGPVPVQQH